jgi:hypothetical protein
MKSGRSTFSALAWDGFLPLFVAAIPLLLKWAGPRDDIGQILAVILLPPIAALARSAMIGRQLAAACRGQRPSHRQVLAAAAIVVLLMFEVGMGIASFDGKVGAGGATFIGAIYLVYVLLIHFTLRPMPTGEKCAQ